MTDDKEFDRVSRWKVRAEIKRSTAIANIRAIHALASQVSAEPSLIQELLVASTDLDTWWVQFIAEDDAVLDHLMLLNKADEYVLGLTAEVRSLIYAVKVIANQHAPKGAELIDLSYLNCNIPSRGPHQPPPVQSAHNDTSPIPIIIIITY